MGSQRVGHDWVTSVCVCVNYHLVYWCQNFQQIFKAFFKNWKWNVKIQDKINRLYSQHSLEREMVTHSSIHAWKIPWTKEPGGLQSMGLQRVGHDWVTSVCVCVCVCVIHRREFKEAFPWVSLQARAAGGCHMKTISNSVVWGHVDTPIFSSGESHGQRSLAGYSS